MTEVYLLMISSVEHIPRCRIGTISNLDLLAPEYGSRKTNRSMLSSRAGPCVSTLAPYAVKDHFSP